MADAKISAFPVAVPLTALDKFPVLQDGANVVGTIGQLKTFAISPIVSNVTAGAISNTAEVALISGDCTLGIGSTVGTTILLVSSGAGKVTSTQLPLNGFTFAASGATLQIIWLNGAWNVISVYGMTPGVA